MGTSRQALYQSEQRSEKRAEIALIVKSEVEKIRIEMPRLGTRKLYYLLAPKLKELGIKLGRDGLFSILRGFNLLIKKRKKYTQTTDSKHWLRKYPNLLKEQIIYKPEQVFVSDITYIKSKTRTHYLSLVTDAYSRKIMGYHLSDDMSAESVVKALKMAIKNKITAYPTIHHSDRGSQYCSAIYQQVLRKNKMNCSMTDGYDCYQNALAERINGILKDEFLYPLCCSEEVLKQLIKESIQIYNQRRPHLSLNMATPDFIHQKDSET